MKQTKFTIEWSWEDIQGIAEDNGVILKRKDCIAILNDIRNGARDVMVAHGNEVLEQCLNEHELFQNIRDGEEIKV